MSDPAAVTGPIDARCQVFTDVFNMLMGWVDALTAASLSTLDKPAIVDLLRRVVFDNTGHNEGELSWKPC